MALLTGISNRAMVTALLWSADVRSEIGMFIRSSSMGLPIASW